MLPRSICMLVHALQQGDKKLEEQAIRALSPKLEVSVIREKRVRYMVHDPEDVRIFGFMLQPRTPVSLLFRIRWRYTSWPADYWKQTEFWKPEYPKPEYPEGPSLS